MVLCGTKLLPKGRNLSTSRNCGALTSAGCKQINNISWIYIVLNVKSIEILFNIIDPSTKKTCNTASVSLMAVLALTNHQKWLNKNQSNWQIHGDDSCDDL